jgi:hypothetical protein
MIGFRVQPRIISSAWKLLHINFPALRIIRLPLGFFLKFVDPCVDLPTGAINAVSFYTVLDKRLLYNNNTKGKVKRVEFAVERAMKAQGMSRGISLPFL